MSRDPEHRSIRLPGGGRLHVVHDGPPEGDAVLLLHGWPQTAHAWRRVTPLLAEAGYRVLVPDLRGFGDSFKPDDGFDKKTVARDLYDLLNALGITRAWVVGYDMGGQVAYPFTAQWPDMTRGLVFIESGLPGFGQENAMDAAKSASWHFAFNRAGPVAEALVSGREHLFIDALIRRESVGVFDPEAVSEADIAVYARKAAAPGALRCMFAYYRALLPTDLEDNRRFGPLPQTLPVLAVGADHGYGEAALATMRRVSSAPQFWMAKDCGHYVPEERPRDLVDALLRFFAVRSAEGD